MKRFMFIATALVATPLFACGDEDSLESLMREYDDEYATQAEIECDCFAEQGYPDRASCEADGQPLPSEQRCIQDALERDEKASRDWLECRIPLEREYTACIDARLQCGDYSEVDACYEDFAIGVDNCIELPVAVSRAIENCYEGTID
jgi:hypothetical protein